MIRRGLLGLLLSLLLAQIVFAHARYVRSQPGEGAVVATAPDRVEIWFSEELFRRQGANTIGVFGPDGAVVHNGEAQIDDDDRSHIWVDLQEGLAAGVYRVAWTNLSADDGDSDEGEFTFIVDPQAEVTSTPMLAETPAAPPAADSQAAPSAAPTVPVQAPETGNTGNGCFLGLLPLVGLLVLSGTAAGKRKR